MSRRDRFGALIHEYYREAGRHWISAPLILRMLRRTAVARWRILGGRAGDVPMMQKLADG
jgi:hypothetical protein